MLIENGIIRVGAEIEVARFKPGSSVASVAEVLVNNDFMLGTPQDWTRYHDYNCKCNLGCGKVASGDLFLPKPLVSIQYDASLPTTGAEFIVSPVLLIDGMREMREVWEHICSKAVWDNQIPAMRGNRNASPSIHLHVSVDKSEGRLKKLAHNDQQRITDALHALSLFGPELILLSDVPDARRGISFRQPWRHADGRGNHHGFAHIRRLSPLYVHIEWRMFEAAYQDWNYFETAAYLSAALTRALTDSGTVAQLMSHGYMNPPPHDLIERAIMADDTAAVLAMAHPDRLNALEAIMLNEMYDDPYGHSLIHRRYEEVRARV